MALRTTLSLLAVVATLVAVLLFTREKPLDQGNVDVALLAGHRLGSAVRIQWQFGEQAPIELQRTPGGPFRVALPIDDLASQSYVATIAQTYDSAMIGETPLADTEENRKKTGLQVPRLVVDIDFEDGQHQHLEFGAEGPLGTDVFVRRDGRIWRGGLGLMTSLHVGLDDLRERRVFQTPPPAAREIVVDRRTSGEAREVLRLVRSGGGWELMSPIAVRADGGAAESFVRSILSLRIDVFPDGVMRLPEGQPDIHVVVRGGARDEELSLWRDTQENVYGRLADRKIHFKSLNSQYFDIFLNGVDALRARILLQIGDVYSELVAMLVDAGPDQPRIRLVRDTATAPWRLVEPIEGAAEATPANELLTAINNLRAVTFAEPGADPAAHGLRSSGLSVAVLAAGEQRPTTIRFGDDTRVGADALTFAARADRMAEIVTVPKGAVDQIRRPWTSYVPLRIFHVTDAVTRVDLRRKGGVQKRLYIDAKGRWADRDGAAVDDAAVADYVDQLRDLSAKSVSLLRELQLGEPDWELVLGRNSDADDGVGFGKLYVWDREGRPLVVRSHVGLPDVAGELTPTRSQVLRQLWR